jgi:hypothetical protein
MEKSCKSCLILKEHIFFRKGRLKCKECEKNDGKKYRQSDRGKEKTQKWIENNKEKFAIMKSNYHVANREKINNIYNQRYKTDPLFKLRNLTKRRISLVIHKNQSTDAYIGCSINDLKEWLQFCFTNDFSFSNHGKIWHVDHVIPIKLFNLNNDVDINMCFNWKNLMPLKKEDNLKKGKKIDNEQVKLHLNRLQDFHKLKNNKLPEDFYDMFAKHLRTTGSPLEH